jgi:type II secretory pathway pseudopilin PulG
LTEIGGSELGSFILLFGGFWLACIALLVSLIVAYFSRSGGRYWLLAICAVSLLVIITFRVLPSVQWSVRRTGFERAAKNGTTLIHAIDAYINENGKPPKTLESLVPKHVSEITSTGLFAYPEFEYAPSNQHTYELRIECGEGLNWDRFFYWPDQNYPNGTYKREYERIGDWCYWHE